MINSDNSISRNKPKANESDKTQSDRPEGKIEPDKFREVYAMNEKRRNVEEDDDEGDGKVKKKKGDKGERAAVRSDYLGASVKSSLLSKQQQMSADDEEEDSASSRKATLLENTKDEDQPKKTKASPKEFSPKYSDKYVHERPDLASANPFQPVQPIESNVQTQVQAPPAKSPLENLRNLQELFDKIADEAVQVKQGGDTSTIITLNKENGIFSEATVKITESVDAKGQLNITIDNLRPDAKALIDSNQSSLMLSLERKGYQLQQLITTTEIEIPRIDSKELAREGKSGQKKR